MKDIAQKVLLFWKMANGDNDPWTKENYDNWIKTYLPTADLYDISPTITWTKYKPFFKLEDFLPRIYEVFEVFQLTDEDNLKLWFNEEVEDNIRDANIESKIRRYVLERYANEADTIGVKDYLSYEQYNASGDTLRKAQTKVIKGIISNLQSDNDKTKEKGIKKLGELAGQSRMIGIKLLEGLAKHYGIDVYEGVIGKREDHRPSFDIDEELNKPKLNVFDVAKIFRLDRPTKEQFLQIIEKIDDKAKAYMQGFLWKPVIGRQAALDMNEIFMLDAEMQPVNWHYKRVELPPRLFRLPISYLLDLGYDEEYKRWLNLFHEFKIIPQ